LLQELRYYRFEANLGRYSSATLQRCLPPNRRGEQPTAKQVEQAVIEVQEVSTQEWTVSQLERKAKVLAGESVLASMRTDHALIAWAESHDLMVRIDRSGIWGNPYEVDADGTREEVITWYEEYFAHKRSLHKRLEKLKGRVTQFASRETLTRSREA
jgi:Domain of unknown function (DUF4326)